MRKFPGLKERHSYFEGWYLKHQKNGHVFSILPVYFINEKEEESVQLQITTEDQNYSLTYSVDEFYVDDAVFYCKVGRNIFSSDGCDLDIQTPGLTLQGRIRYGKFIPVRHNLMGMFKFLPGIRYEQKIISMAHQLKGNLVLNGTTMDFHNGIGYIEKDWGRDFPRSYVWSQCNWYDQGPASIMIWVGTDKLLSSCAIYYQGSLYRIGAFKGARRVQYSKSVVILSQGIYRLQVKIYEQHEGIACDVRYRFYIRQNLIFDIRSKRASLVRGL